MTVFNGYIDQSHQVVRNIRGNQYRAVILQEVDYSDRDAAEYTWTWAEEVRNALRNAGYDAILRELPAGQMCPERAMVLVNTQHLEEYHVHVMSIINRYI